MRMLPLLLAVLFGCEGRIQEVSIDAGLDIVVPDAAATPAPDASTTAADAAASDGSAPRPEPDPEPTPPSLLAGDLRVTRVTLYQSVQVPLVIDGMAADREALPIVAGRAALVRIGAEALREHTSRAVTGVIEIESGATVARFSETKVLAPPEDAAFYVRVPGEALVAGARFRARIEAEDGVPEAPDATYPRDGSFEELGVEVLGAVAIVLVPFRYDTDGSGRLPDTSEAQLARYLDELTSRFPFAEVDLRVHEVVPWSRSTRYNGNVDWGAVNARLIAMRDAEDAPEQEYWYGLMAPHTSRASYCDSTEGSCVTGQSYVSTLRGSRVGSGVGFGDVASVRTFAHELGHMHGRYHAPCGTRGTDEDYPYTGGVIGTWGWDRRTDTFHAPDEATDMLGYCRNQWISDYTYRAIYERHRALLSTFALRGPPPAPVARRFVTLEDGLVAWSDPVPLRHRPGAPTTGTWLDAAGRALGTVEVGGLEPAHGGGRVWVVPAARPSSAALLRVDGSTLPL